jgi:hypothetical protein
MEEILLSVYSNINEYVNYLNWYFMKVFLAVIIGLTKTPMLDWYKDISFIPKREDKLIWITGIIIMGIFLFFVPKTSLNWDDFENVKHYIGGLLQSYIITIVLHTFLIKKFFDKFK